MKRMPKHDVTKESLDDMRGAQPSIPGLETTSRDKIGTHTDKISAGDRDEICVCRESRQTFILTNNPYLGYVVLEVFTGDEKSADLFLEYHKVIEIFGTCDMAPFTLMRCLRNHLCS